jgi:hypothetical protein
MGILAPTMMGGTAPRTSRDLALAFLYPELEDKFGSFDRPPAEFLTAVIPAPPAVAAPVARAAAARPVAGPGPASMTHLERMKQSMSALYGGGSGSGVDAVLDAVTGPFANFNRNGIEAASDGPAYGSQAYFAERYGNVSDDEEMSFRSKPVLNGREMEFVRHSSVLIPLAPSVWRG